MPAGMHFDPVERDLARFDARISLEQKWDAAVERLTADGIACDRCGFEVFPYRGTVRESFYYRTRQLMWTERIDQGEITWRCPDCGEIARVCV